MEIQPKLSKLKQNNLFLLLFIILISLLPLRSFFHQGMIKSHDGEIHIARLANFYSSLKEGNLFPRWGANLNNGYGHPTLMFLYPLPNYIGSIFYSLGFSLSDSIKILFILGYIFSGLFFYLFLKKLFNSESAIFGTIIFLYTPYRFVDMFIRGALPEHLFFTFASISLYLFLLYLESPNKIRYIALSLSLGALILVHNASAFLFYPFLYIFIMILSYYKEKKISLRLVLLITIPFFFAILLTSFYWIPAIVEGKYTLRNIIINKNFTVSHLVKPEQLLSTNWGYGDPRYENGLSTQVGIINILVFLLFTFFWQKTKKILSTYLLFYLLILVFLMTVNSKAVWLSNNILFNIHFPWRLLVMVTFISGIVASSLVSIINRNYQIQKILKAFTIGGLFLVVNFITREYQKPSGYFQKQDTYYLNEYNGTADNGESSPVWSTLNTEYERKPAFESINGEVVITDLNKKSEKQTVNIKIISDKAQILANTLYFPGWAVYDNNINITSNIQFQDPSYRGLITFWLNKGNHEVVLLFKNTKVRQYSVVISLFTIIFFFLPIKKLFVIGRKSKYNLSV